LVFSPAFKEFPILPIELRSDTSNMWYLAKAGQYSLEAKLVTDLGSIGLRLGTYSGAILLKYYDKTGEIIGTFTVIYTSESFWYEYKFFKQNLSISYTWEFRALRGDDLIFSPDENFDEELFLKIQKELYEPARVLDFRAIQKSFMMAAENPQEWLTELSGIKPTL
jgi:hypothetical protein